MSFKTLAGNLLGIVKAAAPMVGMGEEVAAAEALIKSIGATIDGVRDDLDSDDAVALDSALAALKARVDAHADRTIASLG